jgi:Tat protein secretion system quality control protein TatD with DNase activity
LLFHFGISHAVNHHRCTREKARKKGKEAVRAVPPDRLLVESDVHAPPDVALGTAGAVAYVAQARGEKLELVADLSARNGLRFLSSLGFNQPNADQPTLT